MATITPANIPQLPQQPFLPIGYQPSYPGHSIPVYEGPSAPIEPPPSYMESEAQAHSPGVFAHGQPTYPFQLHPYTSPPYSDELDQPPYNPSYD
ncbi:RNA-binding protein 33-like [Scomber scombrus]|nr:RNA-binding protein 33-like [Scomber scombrus]